MGFELVKTGICIGCPHANLELNSFYYGNDERYYEIHCLHLPACLRMIEETKMRLERGEQDG